MTRGKIKGKRSGLRLSFSKKQDSNVENFDGTRHKSGELNWSGDLQLVRKLDLTGETDLKRLPDDIGSRAPWLDSLILEGCESLQTLPHSLGQLSMLCHVDLTGCTSLSWLPSSLSCLTSLQSLTVTRCSSLTELPPGIGFLGNLQELNTVNCARLAALPYLRGLTALSRLDLFGNAQLSDLPLLGELVALEYLDVSHCALLRNLPDSFGECTGAVSHLLCSADV